MCAEHITEVMCTEWFQRMKLIMGLGQGECMD